MQSNPGATCWYVLGAGAMGCLWAARLSQSAVHPYVTLILRDEASLAEFPGHITFESTSGETTQIKLNAITASQLNQPVHHLLVTTKAFDTKQAITPLLPWLEPESTVLLLQNGIRNHLHLNELTSAQVLSMSTTHGAWLRQRFHVVHAGLGQAFTGPVNNSVLPGHQSTDRPNFPNDLIQSMNIAVVENMEDRLWQKFAINCVINGLTVIHNCQNGDLLTQPSAHQALLALCEETECVLQKAGYLDRELYPLVKDVLETTRSNWSSTWQDVQAGRETEIAEFNGYLCELAALSGLPSPHNRDVYERVSHAMPVIR